MRKPHDRDFATWPGWNQSRIAEEKIWSANTTPQHHNIVLYPKAFCRRKCYRIFLLLLRLMET